ncbi:MAG TPA: hypothetical protein VMW41_00480 [Candidatus Bathyarchaeia archaeon]|nr:hypothetical protein [Candidatus Bathyarchaeia archaeon]
MAKARMLHTKISVSIQVNRLTLPARLLFSWMIPHADDEGRLKGDPEYIKATVTPMTRWSFKKIGEYLNEIKDKGLIYYWQENGEWFIEFIKWNEHQTIRKDRFIRSNLPSYSKKNDNQVADTCQPTDNQETTQANRIKSNPIESNKSEFNETNADKNSFKRKYQIINPKNFNPNSEGKTAALEAWKKLEPANPCTFKTTYLNALRKGLPTNMFYQFVSEIQQDKSVKKPGAVFNKKVKDYLDKTKL